MIDDGQGWREVLGFIINRPEVGSSEDLRWLMIDNTSKLKAFDGLMAKIAS
jgi:hypothetical protein